MNLRHLRTLFRKEIASYFNSAIAYIFIIVFVLLNAGLFMSNFFLIGQATMRPFFAILPFLLAVFLPAVTMRLWAEEKRGNTLELLLTFPMKTEELVVGKFLASFGFYLVALAATVAIPLMLMLVGRPDYGAILGGYVGAALLGALFLAVGIFISGFCRDQIVAFILSMMVCFSLHLVGMDFLATIIDGWIPGVGTFLQNFVATARHYDSFAKGVVAGGDVLYFLVGTVVFLVLNGFWLEGRLRPKARTIFSSAVVISLGIFLLANWFFSSMALGRFDLTEGQIYTVSPTTKDILRNLKAPVTVKLYISPAEKMPTGMKTLEREIVDKLDELRIASAGHLDYKIFHMEAAKVVEEAAHQEKTLEEQLSEKGIQPFQVQSIEADEVGVRLVYSAISIAYKEKPEELIPRIVPANVPELEYLLISRIYRMTLEQTPRIALVAPYEERAVDPQLKALFSQLGASLPAQYREDEYEIVQMALEYEGYKVNRIRLTEKEPVPEGVKTLIVLEPREMTKRQRYELNRFLVSGGSLFLAVQQYDYDYVPMGRYLQIRPLPKEPNVNSLLERWGLKIDTRILADEQHEAINLGGVARVGPFPVSIPVKFPIHIVVPPGQMNPNISITSRLSSLFYLWGTAIELDEEKMKQQGLKSEILFTSSKNSWTVPFQPFALTPQALERQPDSPIGPFPLAVFVQGQFADAFSGQPVPPWVEKESGPGESSPKAINTSEQTAKEAEDQAIPKEKTSAENEKVEETPAPEITPAPGKLILTGAATMFRRQLVQGGGHLAFLMNAVDVLALGEELVHIRSKQPIDRTIGHVSTAEKVFWRFMVTVFVPLLIAMAGGFRMILRRQAKQNYLKMLRQAS